MTERATITRTQLARIGASRTAAILDGLPNE
jgi:hypothetical protein